MSSSSGMPSSPLGRIGGPDRNAGAGAGRLDPLALGRTSTSAGDSGMRAFTPATSDAGSSSLEQQFRGYYDDASTPNAEVSQPMDQDATPRKPRVRNVVNTEDIPSSTRSANASVTDSPSSSNPSSTSPFRARPTRTLSAFTTPSPHLYRPDLRPSRLQQDHPVCRLQPHSATR
jgi:hypothetical protein